LREEGDAVEREGVRRGQEAMDRADLVLLTVDGSEPAHPADEARLKTLAGRNLIIARNKTDLGARLELPPGTRSVGVSCATGEGIEALKDEIKEMFWKGELQPEMTEAMLNARHLEALRRAGEAIQAALSSLEGGETLEITALELRFGALALGEIVGKTTTEDLLDSIFSQFCIGK
jgi:tRNA modification GTPase